jgi:hypothetical protein
MTRDPAGEWSPRPAVLMPDAVCSHSGFRFDHHTTAPPVRSQSASKARVSLSFVADRRRLGSDQMQPVLVVTHALPNDAASRVQ